jgi:hypothetical protein
MMEEGRQQPVYSRRDGLLPQTALAKPHWSNYTLASDAIGAIEMNEDK